MGKILSFGYGRRSQPPQADVTEDVRQLSHDMSDPRVDVLVARVCKDYKPGQVVAIGCEKGQHRSVEIAKLIAAKLKLRLQHRDK